MTIYGLMDIFTILSIANIFLKKLYAFASNCH